MSISSRREPTGRINELKHQVKVAVGHLGDRIEPQVVSWNGEALILCRSGGKRGDAALRRPGCLGVYSDGATFDQLLADLLYVVESEG
jgi:hypothetical protein